jgi:DNA repair protein RecO (recombination protein O)
METLGQFLKREREFRGISLERLAGLTRINSGVLKKLEEDNFGKTTEAIYVRSFLKLYAGHLGLDAAEILRRYEGQAGIEPLQTPVAAPVGARIDRIRGGYSLLWRSWPSRPFSPFSCSLTTFTAKKTMMNPRGRDLDAEAIVLSARTIGENDLRVDLLTPGVGRLHAVARHGRKSHKRFGTVLETFNWVRIRAKDGGGWVSLNEASLVKPWLKLDEHLARLTAAFHAVELVRQLVPERNPDAKVFHLLAECLAAIDQASPRDVLTPVARFEYRLLEASGLGPHLTSCLSCGRNRAKEEGGFFFVYKEGGLFCARCLPPGLVFDPFSRESASKILSQFVEYQIGRPLKTRKFLSDPAFCG